MSDEKSHLKGLSLRRKKTVRPSLATRPTISAPRQISAPRDPSIDGNSSRNPSVWSNDSEARPREPRPSISGRDNTSDLVKRRYSTRFAAPGQQQDGMVPPIPAMPAMPAQYADTMSRSPPKTIQPRNPDRERYAGPGKLRIDMRAMRDPNLAAEKYVQSILGDASEKDIQAYQEELQHVKISTSAELQHNVYQNRTQFIRIAKEADKLKTEMRTLRTLMNDLTGTLGHATNAGATDMLNGNTSMSDRKRANRSSVANLEAMWSSHLQTLWKRIEGSQKYLPALPGRHIIMESPRWVELNAATWKPKRRICLVLLNDHLLVASEKKVQTQNALPNPKGPNAPFSPGGPLPQTALIAERCWALQDVSLVDISNRSSNSIAQNANQSKAIANAINIRAGNESFTYAISDNAEKAGLLVAFRKSQEDLRKKMAAEHGERERAMDELALLTGRDPRSLQKAAAAANAAEAEDPAAGGLTRSNSVLIDVEGRQQSLRWVESQIDSLDIDVALQRFEESVARVEKLRKIARSIKGNAAAQDIILSKINERAAKLASSISRQLVQTSAGTERTKENVSWLLRLGYEEMARIRYLESRTDTIRLRQRQLPFTGALVPYLQALSYTTFTLLLHTFRTFAASFPPAAGSSAVKWAKERVDEFNALFGRQLSSVERGGELWIECVTTVREQAKVLNEVAVDFSNIVAKGFDERPVVMSPPSTNGAKFVPVGLGVST
ncbi:exocyst complex component exo84 [Acrodontium crateriforme]|uniref:Exocyst complex component EXO84 n=1 Tax=Acrodontium crateriforme TaxID=150365 RepID=A0AAQ3MBA8_9PEZI|nr:exocyst complex component exo84 [Acrodontium crateriforme]